MPIDGGGEYGACIPRAWKFGPGNPGHMPGHIPGNPGHIEPAVREKRSLGSDNCTFKSNDWSALFDCIQNVFMNINKTGKIA